MSGTCCILVGLIFLAGCNRHEGELRTKGDKDEKGEIEMEISITSTAFNDRENIPKKYTGDGRDVSPPLDWKGIPDEAESLALICDDPDAPVGDWIHWVLFDMPAELNGLPEDVPPEEVVLESARQGVNDFGKIGYGGPAPPPGKPHRYIFSLYALDRKFGLPPGATKDEVMEAMQGHIVAESRLVGMYER